MSKHYHGLTCGHTHAEAAASDDDDDGDGSARKTAATSNVTDLRRARQRARAVVRDVMRDIKEYLRQQNVETALQSDEGRQRVNRAITLLAARRFESDLVSWLADRHKTTGGRAARAAFDAMQTALPSGVDDDAIRGSPRITGSDREWLRQLRQVDVGLLSGTKTAQEAGATSDSLAQKLGDRMTRQLRLGVNDGETVQELSKRVEYVMDKGDAPGRNESGVTGQTTRSKAELIAHDSVQDAYNTAARKRYLRNGFRYAVFDATIDTKTTDLCRRMNEVVIDIKEDPWLIPGLHPYCRSGIRPILDVGDRDVVGRDDIADDYVNTIMQTKSYRPPVQEGAEFRPTPLSQEYGHADGE